MKYIVDTNWLFDHLYKEDVRIIDCRYSLANPEEGLNSYQNKHIPGSVYFDLEKDLSSEVGVHGGRHPIPDVKKFVNKLEGYGINENTTVIAYDQGNAPFAARFLYLMHLLGHKKVYILNGGWDAWITEGHPTDQNIPIYSRTHFEVCLKPEIIATYEEVRSVVENKKTSTTLIDSREEKRFRGLVEPIDKKAGHIPGAINKVWTDCFINGRYKMENKQAERFKELNKDQPVIVYCGSGVTAAPNYVSLKEAGFDNVKVYVGSFSDWVSYDENEIETNK